MTNSPILSIVTPTLGKFSEHWLQQLLAIQGEVEFILVYPPGAVTPSLEDPRVKTFHSLYQGETAQRAVGLLNASGQYVLALDDDDFLHPEVVALAKDYFDNFPQSWLLRLHKEKIDYLDEERIKAPWPELPAINQLNVSRKRQDKYQDLVEVPIAPLDNPFELRLALWPYAKRKDIHGCHLEPFNNTIWKTTLVKEALDDFVRNMRIGEILTWLPLWGFDRALGLFIQGKFFQKDMYIGHWMPEPSQIRYIVRPYSMKSPRILFPSDALLVKRFPQYGYFWNLFFEELYNGIKTKIKSLWKA
jgi:glycosyltransferase involved in cell wall biosynthesis